jgi:hypothetical protein
LRPAGESAATTAERAADEAAADDEPAAEEPAAVPVEEPPSTLGRLWEMASAIPAVGERIKLLYGKIEERKELRIELGFLKWNF